jgi:hypothetical protein
LVARNQAAPRPIALSVLLLGLLCPGWAGATDYFSVQDGSWFDASTWGQSSTPADGDNVEIFNVVSFDPSTSGESVTVSNLTMDYGTLWMSGPSSLATQGTNGEFVGTNNLNGIGGVLYNQGTIFQTDTGLLIIGNETTFENQANATYNLQTDGSVAGSGYSYFNNSGLFYKSGGTGASTISVPFNNVGGSIQVDSGTLSLAGSGISTSGTFIVATNAVLDLTGGSGQTWAGVVGGSGAGAVSFNSGSVNASPSLTLNLPDGLFQWTGGALWGITVNSNAVTVAGTVYLNGEIYNDGLVHHTNDGTMNFGNNATIVNQSDGIYNFEGDGGLAGGGYTYFYNYGLLRKSSGSGISSCVVSLNNQSGVIEVESGTLSLAGSGASSNGTFNVASGAVLDLTGGQSSTWAGVVGGSGAGGVSLNSGNLIASPSLTLNLPGGLFQWTGGTLYGTTFNSNAVTVAGTVSMIATIYNDGLVHHTNDGMMNFGYNATFNNQSDGIYNFEGDGGLGGNGYSYFNNCGLLRKSSGSGISSCTVSLNNQSGVIEVDSGTLSLAGSGTSSNGTFNVASGAVLDLTGGQGPTWAGVVGGSGAGSVSLNSGYVLASPSLTLNLPDGLFQWTGGTLYGNTTNSTAITVAGAGSAVLHGVLYNYGLLHHTNTATLHIAYNSAFENQAGGTYNLEGDGVIYSDGYGYFDNYGLLRKSGGTGTSSINSGVTFQNLNGSIEVNSGQLSLSGQNYSQGGGGFIVTLGGINPGQSGQFACGSASLGGPLKVTLAGGFVPAPGNQFQILSCSSLAGAFTSTNIPAGMVLSYSNNGVYLTVPLPAQILNPVVCGGNLTFSFASVNCQSNTLQHNDDLTTSNWVCDTNCTGDGTVMQMVAPLTNSPQRFFRVVQP